MPHYSTSKAPKVVRFAYQNTFHSPPPLDTPALSFSSSTIPSSSGPITPPSAMMGLPGPMPYVPAYTPVKPRYAAPARPHPYLDASAVSWDLRDHQSAASRKHYSVSSRSLCEAATSPPLPSITIISQHLPWSIKVYASNHSFVTLEDVLSSIYRSLRTNITPKEFNTAFRSPNDQQRATRAYEQRYRRQRSVRIYEEEKRGGMKRVDFFMGHTQFNGISNDGRRPDEWHLHVT